MLFRSTDWNFATKTARYCQIGKNVYFQATLSGVVTVGSASDGKISLPVGAKAAASQNCIGRAIWQDNSAGAAKEQGPYIDDSDLNNMMFRGVNGISTMAGNEIAASDTMILWGCYEAA